MKLYMAPMEGYTNYVYRNIYRKYFYDFDKYFTPFIATNKKASLNSKELKDIRPEDNQGLTIIPQLMTNNPEDCLATCRRIQSLGYQEVNINMGCPSGTVTNKGRGAGMLYDTDKLKAFLDSLFEGQPSLKISVKTRLGRYEAEEFYPILEIYNEYPLEELIIHPRTREDFYGNVPNLTVFEEAMKLSRNPVCYNGDIFTKQDYENLLQRFSTLDKVMLGRGIIGNPGLAEEVRNGTETDRKKVKDFHNELLTAYSSLLSGDKNILYKMKSFWVYMGDFYCDEKTAKKIKKVKRLEEYKSVVDGIW